jgi:hypothetical protein
VTLEGVASTTRRLSAMTKVGLDGPMVVIGTAAPSDASQRDDVT